MSIKSWNLLLVLGLLVALGAGSGILYDNHLKAEAAAEQARIEAAEEARIEVERIAALKASFETFLNDFIRDTFDKMQEYKKRRAVLNELVSAENLGDPAYIEENAKLAESTVLALKLQAENVLGGFEAASERVAPLIAEFKDEGDRGEVQARWDDVRNENAEKYLTFFDSDQGVIGAQLDLITFYSANREALVSDVENDRVIFESVALQEQEALLRGAILQARVEQDDALRANEGEE